MPADELKGGRVSDYVTVDQLKQYLDDPAPTLDTASMQAACTVASRRVDALCGRYFYQDATVSAKTFAPVTWDQCDFVDPNGQRWDLSTTTGLLVAIDLSYNGTYSTSLTYNTDFELTPENGSKNGQPWAFDGMVLISGFGLFRFPPLRAGYRSPVRVTGKWGWAAVPSNVIQASLILAAQIYKNKDNVGGFIGFDSGAVRVREDPLALMLLQPFAQTARMVA